jgi:hypothetical protein
MAGWLAQCVVPGLAVVSLLLQSFGLPFLVRDVPEAFLQCGHFTEPLHAADLAEALVSVAFDLQQAGNLAQRESEHWASNTSLTEMILKSAGALFGRAGNPELRMESRRTWQPGVSWL